MSLHVLLQEQESVQLHWLETSPLLSQFSVYLLFLKVLFPVNRQPESRTGLPNRTEPKPVYTGEPVLLHTPTVDSLGSTFLLRSDRTTGLPKFG